STIFLSQQEGFTKVDLAPNIDFFIRVHAQLGSVLLVNGTQNESYISEIQHVRRRESIAMTPANCHAALKSLIDGSSGEARRSDRAANKALVLNSISEVTGTRTKALIASSGLSMQYAIMMGLIHDAL